MSNARDETMVNTQYRMTHGESPETKLASERGTHTDDRSSEPAVID